MPDAIPTDVSTPQQEQTDNTLPGAQQEAPEVEPRLSRAEMMARLAESRKASLIEDGYDPNATTPAADPDDTSAADAAALDVAGQVERQQAEETILSDDQLANVKIRTKVNGVEQLVSLDQVRAGFQKTESADRYLAEAKQMLGEVKALRSQPAAPATDAAPTEPAPDQTSQEPDPIDASIDALFQGDETRAKELLRRAVAGHTAPNAEQIARQVEQQIVIRSALRQFAKDHRDIASDPDLAAKADKFIYEITGGRPIEALPPDQVMEVFEEAGRRTKDWIRTKAGISGEPSQATTRNERLARKTSIDNLPAASARATVVEPPPKTASTVIDAMRRARGQV